MLMDEKMSRNGFVQNLPLWKDADSPSLEVFQLDMYASMPFLPTPSTNHSIQYQKDYTSESFLKHVIVI